MSFADEDYGDEQERHERRITRCRACNQRIIFLETERGKRMPVDADTVQPDDDEFVYGRHVSHFSTCSNADFFRRT
jgi:uncharacterized protein with PIN domain